MIRLADKIVHKNLSGIISNELKYSSYNLRYANFKTSLLI